MREIKINEKYIKEKISKVIENRISLSILKIVDETLEKELPPILFSEKQKKEMRELTMRIFNGMSEVFNGFDNTTQCTMSCVRSGERSIKLATLTAGLLSKRTYFHNLSFLW